MSIFGLPLVPILPRTLRPSIIGTPVWYAEATQARTQLDINITIPSGSARKLVVLWGWEDDAGAISVTFDPAGVAFPLLGIDEASNDTDSGLHVRAFYLDTPPTGTKTVRCSSQNAVRSAVRLDVLANARAGLPIGLSGAVANDDSISVLFSYVDESLVDAYSRTLGLALGAGLSDGALTPFAGQTIGQDDVINSSFLAMASDRDYANSGDAFHGWTAAAPADLLMCAVNIPFSTGQVAASAFTRLSEWNFNDLNANSFDDLESRSSASAASGVTPGVEPLLADGGASVSVSGAQISAEHHTDWQVPSWSIYAYFQPRSLPADNTNRPIMGKDTGLPVPGGFHLEYYHDAADDAGDTKGKLRAYIRNGDGTAGTAIWIEGASPPANHAYGTALINEAHLVVLTFEAAESPATGGAAKLYHRPAGGSVTLLADKTDANFAGLSQNSTLISLGCRAGTAGVEQEAVLDRYGFGAGVLTQAEIEALPAPVTVSDPLAGGVITAVADNAGNVTASATTDVDVLANDTGKVGPHYDIEIIDPGPAGGGQLSVINDQSASAQIRITTPEAPTATKAESGSYRVRQGASPTFGDPSNTVPVDWTRLGIGGGGGYTPFNFVTVPNPALKHWNGVNGAEDDVRAKPPYSPDDAASVSKVCPMSGCRVIRLTGNFGETVRVNNVATGLTFGKYFRFDNAKNGQQVWNADSSLLMIGRTWDSVSGNVRCALVDVDGSHGASKPWRYVRASGNAWFGDHGSSNWFWDPNQPLAAIVIQSNGAIQRWWPIGSSNPSRSVGQVETMMVVSGVSNAGQAHSSHLHHSYDKRWHVMSAKQVSTGFWGGYLIDIQNWSVESDFLNTPLQSNDADDRACNQTSAYGNYTRYNTNLGGSYNRDQIKSTQTNTVTAIGPNSKSFKHPDSTAVDGVEYFVGFGNGWRMMDESGPVNQTDDDLITKATNSYFPIGDYEHTNCRAFLDQIELVNPVTGLGGSTTGLRYAIIVNGSNTTVKAPEGLLGIRIGANDLNQVRYIGHHRMHRHSNRSECHPFIAPAAEYLAFPSNWERPGVTGGDVVGAFCYIVPDGWKSPNNDGS